MPPTMSDECKEFFAHPLDEHGKVISTYDLDKQLRVYRCALDRRPPESSLATYIANRGEPAIPTLLDRLEGQTDELFQYGIIDILEVMSIKGYLRDRVDVVNRVRQVVAKMKSQTFREMSEKSLTEIEKNSRDSVLRSATDPPDYASGVYSAGQSGNKSLRYRPGEQQSPTVHFSANESQTCKRTRKRLCSSFVLLIIQGNELLGYLISQGRGR
jgi:hypothetical protein